MNINDTIPINPCPWCGEHIAEFRYLLHHMKHIGETWAETQWWHRKCHVEFYESWSGMITTRIVDGELKTGSTRLQSEYYVSPT